MDSILEINGISKSYDKHLVLNNISLSVPAGSIYGLLGPNGAGKTTLIRIVNKIIMPDSGTVSFRGKKMEGRDVEKIGYLPEERGLYNKMMVGEQMLYLARLKGFAGNEARSAIRSLMNEFEILNWWNKKVETLSKGMQQKLQFIVAIMHKPSLVILDEPFSGFDPLNAEVIKAKILELRDQGVSFILSTHRMESVEELCDFMTLINKSNKIIDGNITDIKKKFRKNIFELSYEDHTHSLNTDHNPLFRLISKEKTGDGNLTKIRIDLNNNTTINQVLQEMIPLTCIVSLHEVIPSINEIFISLVKEKNHE